MWRGVFGGGLATPQPEIKVVEDFSIEVYFAPEDGVETEIMEELERSQTTIYFATFTFTSKSIADTLIQEHGEGVVVNGIYESFQAGSRYSTYQQLLDSGVEVIKDGNTYQQLLDSSIEVIKDKNPAFMHHKFFVIDNRTVIMGSFNPTKHANEDNDENILIIHNSIVAELYASEFKRLWKEWYTSPIILSIEKGLRFLDGNLWDEVEGAYGECPPGSEGHEENYWPSDNHLALIFHQDYNRFINHEKVGRIQKFLERNPPSLQTVTRWSVLSSHNYSPYQLYNDWEYADQVTLDGIYYVKTGNIEEAKKRFNHLIENMYNESNGFIEDKATPENGHEYYKLGLALILAHHLKDEDPTAKEYIPILIKRLLALQETNGSWLTDDKPPSWPNTETTILILLSLDIAY